MAKLHELLAVMENLKGQATKVREQLAETFIKRKHLFEEKRITFKSNEPGVDDVVEEQKDIQTSVAQELTWISAHISKAWDVVYQVDLANMKASADIVLEDGRVLVKSVPNTTLMPLEKRIAELKILLEAIPTLDPTKSFSPDISRPEGISRAREVQKTRTKKKKVVLSLAKATDKHAEQVQVYEEDVPVGTLVEQEWSSMITPKVKAQLIENIEDLARAVAKARAKANDHTIETQDDKIGSPLLDYIFQPLKQKAA